MSNTLKLNGRHNLQNLLLVIAAAREAGLNANQIGADGSVGNTEYGYLDGVTSAIQTPLWRNSI